MSESFPDCRICATAEDAVLVRTETSMAFYSPEPVAPSHLVVAVRAHRPLLTDLGAAEAFDLFGLVREVAITASSAMTAEKFYLAAVGDVDKHFHIHLLPKQRDDAGLGPFIFGPAGWKSGLKTSSGPDPRVTEALRSLRRGP